MNINHACQTCHRGPEAELQARAETIQTHTSSVEKTPPMSDLSMLDRVQREHPGR